MKQRILGTILGISMFLMAGCQPTPDGPIVVNKNDGTMEEKIAASPLPAKKYEAPETVEDKFENAKGTITVTVDAEVTVPDLDKYPVAAVRPKQYTQEFVNNLVGYFRKNDEPLFYVDRKPLKSFYEKQRNNLLQAIEEANNNGDTEWANQLAVELKLVEEELKTAPEEYEVSPADINFKNDDGAYIINAEGTLSNGKYLKVNVTNANAQCSLYVAMLDEQGLRLFADAYGPNYTVGDRTKDEAAREKAEKFIAELGLKNYQCTAIYPGEIQKNTDEFGYVEIDTVWAFSFSYCYPQAPMKAIPGFVRRSDAWYEQQNEEYVNPWQEEMLYVFVDETGVIGLRAQGAAEIVEELNRNVYLMPFEEIYAKVDDYIYYNQYVFEGVTEHRVTVQEIHLSYMRIMWKDHPGSYLLIPIWDIMGDIAIVTGAHVDRYEKVSFATINALDGSLIDREKLY